MRFLPLGLALLLLAIWITNEVVAAYSYENSIGSYWDLSEKASTLTQKSTYLDRYVEGLEKGGFEGMNNAVFLKTPNNSFEQNMVALKSLQGRMHQIQGMDEQSFAYQTAIQQITAQEQGEAQHLTSTFEGCWFLKNHTFLWGWIDGIIWFFLIGLLLTGIFVPIAMGD